MVKNAFDILKKYPVPLLAIPFAYSVLELGLMKLIGPDLAVNSVTTLFSKGLFSVGFVLVLYEAVRIMFVAGYLSMILVVVDGGDIDISSFKLFLTKKRLLNVLSLEAVVLPVFAAGLLLLVLPGIYWFVVTIMAYFMVVSSEDIGTFDAISRSITITKGFRLIIFGYSIAYTVILLLASMQSVVSIAVDTFLTPIFYLVLALLYRESTNKHAQ